MRCDHEVVSEGLPLVVGWSKGISPTCSVQCGSTSSTELMLSFPTFGQRVPAGPISDSLVKEIAAVPPVVHPAVSVRIGPRQLSQTNPHVSQKSHVQICTDGVLSVYAPSGIFCHLLWRSKWSSLESADLSICQRDNWLPQLLRGGWPTGQSCSSASIL